MYDFKCKGVALSFYKSCNSVMCSLRPWQPPPQSRAVSVVSRERGVQTTVLIRPIRLFKRSSLVPPHLPITLLPPYTQPTPPFHFLFSSCFAVFLFRILPLCMFIPFPRFIVRIIRHVGFRLADTNRHVTLRLLPEASGLLYYATATHYISSALGVN